MGEVSAMVDKESKEGISFYIKKGKELKGYKC